jgi:uncharacterized protein (TIGR00299 family) protein
MNTLYLDIFSGISGDMFLGALIDLGVDLARLQEELGRLNLAGYHLHVSRQERGAITGTRFDVHTDVDGPAAHSHSHAPPEAHAHEQHNQHHLPHPAGHGREIKAPPEVEHGRNMADIEKLIESSSLSPWVKEKSLAVFRRVALAEGKIHGCPPDQVHFHELGAVDSIVDIVGACIALELLGKPRVLSGPVVEGTGTVRCAHGQFPLPAPATLEILAARSVPIRQCEEAHELVTPTGAALLAEFAESFGPMPGLTPGRIGYGLGARQNQTRPNIVRAVLGQPATQDGYDWETDAVMVLETNLDDVSAEILGHFMGQALAAGALDVFYAPIQMKKNRPGTLLSVLCTEAEADRLTELLLRETSAFGVRRSSCDRRKLQREPVLVRTPHGLVSVKVGRLNGVVVQASPEYESCRQVAEQVGLPLKTVYEAALQAFRLL